MKNEELKNETEILSQDEQKVGLMLKSLKRAEAPKDFEFRLKARLANAKSSDFQPRALRVFRYAAPALAIALLFSALVYQGRFWSSSNSEPPIADSSNPERKDAVLPESALIAESAALPVVSNEANTNLANLEAPSVPNGQMASVNPKPSKIARKPVKKKEVFNRTIAWKNAVVIEPLTNANVAAPASNPIASPRMPENFVQESSQSVEEVLSFIGIKSTIESGKWRVQSVAPNSLADRSGVKINDVVESLNNQPISPATTFSNKFEGKTITVSRGGEKVEIKLQNK